MRETPVGKEEGYGEGATPKSPSYKVVGKIAGEIKRVRSNIETFEEAQRIADVLNEGAQSNPRSTAFYWVEEED
jgi:hypothetical protein